MASNATSRQTVREHLATLLHTRLVTTLTSAQVVYDYVPADFDGQSPAVCVTSMGTDRAQLGFGEDYNSAYQLAIVVYVLYAEQGTAYGEDDAEDVLDLLEKQIADCLMDYRQVAGKWDSLLHNDMTRIDYVTIGGATYKQEVIAVVIEE